MTQRFTCIRFRNTMRSGRVVGNSDISVPGQPPPLVIIWYGPPPIAPSYSPAGLRSGGPYQVITIGGHGGELLPHPPSTAGPQFPSVRTDADGA